MVWSETTLLLRITDFVRGIRWARTNSSPLLGKATMPMRIAIQTLGTRGDVQPYIALALGLQEAGFVVSLATSPQFEPSVTQHGLAFEPLPGDIVDLVQTPLGKAALSGRHKLVSTLRLLRKIRPVFERLVAAQWAAAQGADAIVYHPKAIAGVHVAEKLGIPAFVALPLPGLSPTKAFPSPMLPFADLGPLNRASHLLVTRFGDLAFRKTIRRWREEVLGLPVRFNWLTLCGRPVPRLYAYSRAVVPVPDDWDENAVVTGYWFLPAAAAWQPPAELLAFLEGGRPPVYVGFGSLPSADGAQMTSLVLDALTKSNQRGVLATGWGGLSARKMPAHICVVDAAPHDWLFPRMAAVVHHGGAGTTAAGLRAGRPTVVCPAFGDQAFWAHRVHALGAGPPPIPHRGLTADRLAVAIESATLEPAFRERAAALATAIGHERGVANAVTFIQERLRERQTTG